MSCVQSARMFVLIERNSRDTLSSGERKGKSPNPTSLIAAQMSYEGQAS